MNLPVEIVKYIIEKFTNYCYYCIFEKPPMILCSSNTYYIDCNNIICDKCVKYCNECNEGYCKECFYELKCDYCDYSSCYWCFLSHSC